MAKRWVEKLLPCAHHLIGALLLGLRRLENEAQVPLVDLAVLEETLSCYSIWMKLRGDLLMAGYQGATFMSLLDDDRRICCTLAGYDTIEILGVAPATRYLVEVENRGTIVNTGILRLGFDTMDFDRMHSVTTKIPSREKQFWCVSIVSRTILTIGQVDGALAPLPDHPKMFFNVTHWSGRPEVPSITVKSWGEFLNLNIRLAAI